MADERESHNVVTELLKLVNHYTRQGVSMEEALTEVGKRAGHTELKHAFMSLAQVSKHGGEVTRQLQELANSVSLQREAKIEGIIKTLELKATPPVALVFFAFMILLMFMFGSQLMQGLGSM
jgi:pilus assembly protein TadC